MSDSDNSSLMKMIHTLDCPVKVESGCPPFVVDSLQSTRNSGGERMVKLSPLFISFILFQFYGEFNKESTDAVRVSHYLFF